MNKELSPPVTMAIIAVFIVVVIAFGWYMINRNPTVPANAGTPGASNQMPGAIPGQPGGGATTPPANAPSGSGGSQGNQPLTPDV